MSKETIEWLNRNVLVGMSAVRGNAWHRDEEVIAQIIAEGGEDNHYPGAIPAEDAIRRLFHWTADESGLFIPVLVSVDDQGNEIVEYHEVPGYKAIRRSDTGAILGIHSDGYSTDDVQQYGSWLVGVANELGLPLTSAGLLRGGAQGWAQFGLAELQSTPSGVQFLANLLVSASWDGSLGNGYKDAITNTVCDNKMSMALSETSSFKVSVKHTKHSGGRVKNAGDAMLYVLNLAESFTDQVERLCSVPVSDSQWADIVAELAPMPTAKSADKPRTKTVQGIGLDGKMTSVEVPVGTSSRGETVANTKRTVLDRLYRGDKRCAPWAGSAYGVIQTVNTYAHYETQVRNQGDRNERNMAWNLAGKFDGIDSGTAAAMLKVGVMAPIVSVLAGV